VGERPDDRLYPIEEHATDYRVGSCRGGEQVLIGDLSPWLVACFFSPAGDLLRVEERPLAGPAPEADSDIDPDRLKTFMDALEALRRGDTRSVDWRRYVEDLLWVDHRTRGIQRQIAAWKREVGFLSRPIRVKRFWLPDREAGIDDGLHYFKEREDMSEEVRAEERRSRDEWIRAGNFVLHWGRPLWMDRDGKVFVT
jgi:hypothetical protein